MRPIECILHWLGILTEEELDTLEARDHLYRSRQQAPPLDACGDGLEAHPTDCETVNAPREPDHRTNAP